MASIENRVSDQGERDSNTPESKAADLLIAAFHNVHGLLKESVDLLATLDVIYEIDEAVMSLNWFAVNLGVDCFISLPRKRISDVLGTAPLRKQVQKIYDTTLDLTSSLYDNADADADPVDARSHKVLDLCQILKNAIEQVFELTDDEFTIDITYTPPQMRGDTSLPGEKLKNDLITTPPNSDEVTFNPTEQVSSVLSEDRTMEQKSTDTHSPKPRPNSWIWDAATEQWVVWLSPQGNWVNSKGERVPSPQQASESGPLTISSSSLRESASSSFRAAPPRRSTENTSRPAGAAQSIGNSMLQMYVDPTDRPKKATSTKSSAERVASSSTIPRGSSSGYAATHRDPATGIETRWEVSSSSRYTHPVDSSQRSLNVKRIRETDNQQRQTSRTNTPSEYKFGRVIEVLLVPPPLSSTDAVSRITPNDDTSDHGLHRLRRFVIVRDNLDGGKSFEAIAIKTYNSQGVAAPGVIKSHHAVIYTGSPPSIGSSERPRRLGNSQLENGILPQPIRVTPYNLTNALDPMSRLDFGDRYIFDFGVPNIRVWGRVHDDSQAALYVQYSSVWRSIQSSAAGPGPLAVTSSSSSRQLSATTHSAASSRTSIHGAAEGSHQQRRGPPSFSTSKLPSTGIGPITDAQMSALLHTYRAMAVKEDLSWPITVLNQEEIHSLAQNEQARATYFQRIVDSWDEVSDK